MSKQDMCSCCKKVRVIYYNGMCQNCYRSNNYYKKENSTIKRYNYYTGNNELVQKILNLWAKTNLSSSDICKELNSSGIQVSYQYCWRMIKKYGKEVMNNARGR